MTHPVVLGGGSWGTALALVLARRGLPVRVWVHNPELAKTIERERSNESYLPGFPFPPELHIHADAAEALEGAGIVIFAVPSHAMRLVAEQVCPYFPRTVRLVSATKGIEEHTLCRMSEVLRQACGHEEIVCLSGPSFAREVAAEQPTALVAASAHPSLAKEVQRLFSSSAFRVYTSNDLCGVELGGALKNVIAIAAGLSQGLQLGHNALAALITRGLAEMSRLALELGAQRHTLSGLAGLGDLVLTCTGTLSRNRQVGVWLAEGRTLDSISASLRSVAEGIRNADSSVALGHRAQVALPIAEQVRVVLRAERLPVAAMRILMERSLRDE